MKRLLPSARPTTAHARAMAELRHALAERGIAVHLHRVEPGAVGWDLLVGRGGRTLQVRWEGPAGTLHFADPGSGGPTPWTAAAEPERAVAVARAQILAHFGEDPRPEHLTGT